MENDSYDVIGFEGCDYFVLPPGNQINASQLHSTRLHILKRIDVPSDKIIIPNGMLWIRFSIVLSCVNQAASLSG